MAEFTHIDETGSSRMVEVGDKAVTKRSATAGALIIAEATTITRIREHGFKKGNVLSVAQLAGIMGVKRTADLIPLCHPLPLSGVDVSLEITGDREISVTATCRTTGQTGVEMEALTAASIAALTVYDMCKAVDRGMKITDIRLLNKSGGKSGDFTAE